ncbi:MAG: S8 family serine peptidase [Phycisphaerales bacterium]|nr:S8 family serine peptidase [Phycisphaerales bacterium]
MTISTLGAQDGIHLLARFEKPLSNEAREALAADGMAIQNALGQGTYIVHLDTEQLNPKNVMAHANIKELLPLEPRWKLHHSLDEGKIPHWTMPDTKHSDPVVAVYVMYHDDVDLAKAAESLQLHYGAKTRSKVELINTIVVELPFSYIEQLAEEDQVLYIEPALPKFKELNDSNRNITQANQAQASPYGLDGDGVVVMVYDGGYALSSHQDFNGRLTVRDNAGLSNHATHVSGTVGGSGAGNAKYKGMAPAVTIESYGFEQEGGLEEGFLYTDPGDLAEDYGDAINNHGAVLANNSIGTNTSWNGFPCDWTGNYGITSNLIDSVVRGELGGDIRIIWANGNERGSSNCGTSYVSTAPPACAKNHITVGALNSNDESMTSFSSWGPTDDGRIKPDISAPGCEDGSDGGVTSCSSSGGYTTMCGTSMACPTVTGLSALIMQDWRAQFPLAPDMRSSTLKALLAHTAADHFNPGPDNQYGYGSVRVVDAVDHIRSGNFAELEVEQDGMVEMLVYLQEAGDVKVTIAWDDIPATPLVIPSLVNDIDLKVIDPEGGIHYPWTLDPANPGDPAVRTSEDHLNNIEQVQIDSASPGVYRVQVHGYSIQDGDQEFGLMASPLLIQCSSSGLASLDRTHYGKGATIGMQVVDCDLNESDDTIEHVNVMLSSSSGEEIILTLEESNPAAATFVGSAVLGSDLSANEGDTIMLTYMDADDGQGGSNVSVTDEATADFTSPEVNSVTITDVLTREATVNVTTNEPTRATVYYGPSCDQLDGFASSVMMSETHSIELSGLQDNFVYYFIVEVEDAGGNTGSDQNDGNCYTFVTADIPEFFTQQDVADDLDGYSVTFTPIEGVDRYRACTEPIISLPVPHTTGNLVSLTDDDYEEISVVPIPFYGEHYDSIFISSNGRITLDSGSTDYTESMNDHFGHTGVSLIFDDLNPSAGGTVRCAELFTKVVVTYYDVPEYSNTGSNTFQCEFFHDGVIRCSWLGVDSADNIVGLSEGNGIPGDFEQSDLVGADDCSDPAIPGDVNGDGLVNVTDLLAIMDDWGTCDGCPADLNDDGDVNVTDLLIVIGNWTV